MAREKQETVSQNDLLAELNGEGLVHPKVLKQTVKTFDPREEPREDPLQTRARPSTLPDRHARKADEQFSTAVGGKGYKVTLTGEYFAFGTKKEGKAPIKYEVAVNIGSLDRALGVIVGSLLLPALKRKYPDCESFRTYQIASAVPLTPQTPETSHIQYMSREQLIEHIRSIQAPIDPEDYKDVAELREAVIDYSYNPKDFVKRQEKNLASRERKRELKALNPGLEIGG